MKAYLNQNGRCGRRGGFTVVEILVAITVIAILAAMLIPVVGGAMRRANEFAIQSEMSQLDMAIEQFKTDNGFYPPSFQRFTGTNRQKANAVLVYLNRIAPNHNEAERLNPNNQFPRRIDRWWNRVGSKIQANSGADLVFWLSGIAKNKQYPLTTGSGNGTKTLFGFDNEFNDGAERNIYFDFTPDRLVFSGNNNGKVAQYVQAKGKPSPYQYVDAASYGYNPAYNPFNYSPNDPRLNPLNPDNRLPDFHGYHVLVPDSSYPDGHRRDFFNPNSFQLVANGLDGLPGGPVLNNGNYSDDHAKRHACTGLVTTGNLGKTTTTNPSPLTNEQNNGSGADNIVNFIGEGSGKLETKALGID